jgi:hypothetical protein
MAEIKLDESPTYLKQTAEHRCGKMPDGLGIFMLPNGRWYLVYEQMRYKVPGGSGQEVTWCFLCGMAFHGKDREALPEMLEAL